MMKQSAKPAEAADILYNKPNNSDISLKAFK